MKGPFTVLLAIAACFALTAMAVSPAEAATLTVPWGDALNEVGGNVKPTVEAALTATIMAVLLKYAGPFGMLIRNNYVSDLVSRAVDFAFGATVGAQRGKVLTVETSNAVLANVIRYAEGHFPWVLRVFIGGASKMLEKAIARMPELPAEFALTPQSPAAK